MPVRKLEVLRALQSIPHLPEKRQQQPLCEQQNGLFTVKSGNDWLRQSSQTPVPKRLFGEFWNEGEICILFADTNLGKSILAVQIADSISKGMPIGDFGLECQAQRVLYIDFEMSPKQFEARYSLDYQNHYDFSPLFDRAEINPDGEGPLTHKDHESFLLDSLEEEILRSGTKVIIVDNLTYLKEDNERAKDAAPLMKHLKQLKQKHGLSLLVLAHTPKRDLSKPLTKDDLAGSKMLMNFCDSAFAIGESSQDSSIRYLRQVKARSTAIVYDSENVCLCQLEKPSNFLGFRFLGFASESSLLRQYTQVDKEKQNKQILELRKRGFSNVCIGKEVGLSEGGVRKRLKQMGQVDES